MLVAVAGICMAVLLSISAYCQYADESAIDATLWNTVKSRLAPAGQINSFDFIPPVVEQYTKGNPEKQYEVYYALMCKLENHFVLDGAIYAGNKLVALAKLMNKPAKEAEAYMNMSRYYDALGSFRLTVFSLDNAISIYEKIMDKKGLLAARFYWLVQYNRFNTKPLNEVLPDMYKILAEANSIGDTNRVNIIHSKLMELELNAQHFDKAKEHIAYIESLSPAVPVNKNDYDNLMYASEGKAQIARAEGNLKDSEIYYKKALQYSEWYPSKWHVADNLLALAELAWQRKDKEVAISYLGKAREKAEALNLYEMLIQNYDLAVLIAAQEQNYKEAYQFLQQRLAYEALLKKRNAGFNFENVVLYLEKDKLAQEKHQKETELALQKAENKNYIAVILVIAFVAAGIALALVYQQKKRKQLALKNKFIQSYADQLKKLNAVKSRLFTNLNHELRTPLTLVTGPIDTLLAENLLTGKQVKLLHIAQKNGKQLQMLLNNMLDLRKLELSKTKLHPENTRLAAFFKTYLEHFEVLAHSQQVYFFYSIDFADEMCASIDREKCRQVLYNLISNAFKFTPPGGKVTVDIWLQHHQLHIQVKDTGSGIPAEDLPHVFDSFFQAGRKEAYVAGGTGIGLTICSEYAALFGGKITVDSHWGAGSRFHFSFPVVVTNETTAADTGTMESNNGFMFEKVPAAPTGMVQVMAATPYNRHTILVVEDNPDLREYISLLLSGYYRVITAANGQAALQVLAAGNGHMQPDLVLSDVMMPLMDGYQLLERLKQDENTRYLPVIMLTSRADDGDKLQMLRIGVDDYITKPFLTEELLLRIRYLLRNKEVRATAAQTAGKQESEKPALSKADRCWLENFEKYVLSNVSRDGLSVPDLCNEFAMSESTLLRQLKRVTGLSPIQYLQEVRLSLARKLLEEHPGTSVAEAACKVGYSNPRSFSRSFKNRFGVLPTGLPD